MKIMIVTPYFHPRIGGLELYAQHIARGLAGLGREVHIVTSGQTRSTEVWQGLTIHRLPVWITVSNTPFHPFWPIQVRQLIRQIRPNIINVHAPLPSLALATAMVAGRTPLVVTYHTGTMKKGQAIADALIWGYERVLLPLLLRRADAIICSSTFVQRHFLNHWSTKSLTVTPGVDSSLFQPAHHPPQPGNIVFVGDFTDPRKGLAYLIEAIQALPATRLKIIGPGPIPSGPVDRIEYLGVKQGPELVRELQAANLLVLPSTTENESFGMVLVEAMACGLPVIGSRIGGVPYVIADGHDGLLVPPADTKALITAIQYLVINPATARQLGQAGRRKAEREYAWTTRVAITDQLMRDIVANRAATTPEANHA